MSQRLKKMEKQIRLRRAKYFCYEVTRPEEEEKILAELEKEYPIEEKLCVFLTKYEWE